MSPFVSQFGHCRWAIAQRFGTDRDRSGGITANVCVSGAPTHELADPEAGRDEKRNPDCQSECPAPIEHEGDGLHDNRGPVNPRTDSGARRPLRRWAERARGWHSPSMGGTGPREAKADAASLDRPNGTESARPESLARLRTTILITSFGVPTRRGEHQEPEEAEPSEPRAPRAQPGDTLRVEDPHQVRRAPPSTPEPRTPTDAVRKAQKRIGKAASKGRIHKNAAARRTSRLMRRQAKSA